MIEIKKTYKNYVGGKYVRSESGKTYTKELKNEFYELPLTSKKDIRDAVTSSKDGYKKWSSTTPYLRMQILYRLSEMIEGNKESYVELLMHHGLTKQKANKDIDESIQNIVWFAGLADKWEQLAGNLNPVSEEYFNISHQNPIGVVFSLSGSNVSLNELLMSILPALTVGCSVISYSEENSVVALKFAEDIGARISGEVTLKNLSSKIIQYPTTISLSGAAGQSFGAFIRDGINLKLTGNANDYVAKGMAGGSITIIPQGRKMKGAYHAAGNTILYGATGGQLFIAGTVGQRFGVRNSGAIGIVEGCSAHGAEYMTGGTLVVLGSIGFNFGAGMTGGKAIVLNTQKNFKQYISETAPVEVDASSSFWKDDIEKLKPFIDESISDSGQLDNAIELRSKTPLVGIVD